MATRKRKTRSFKQKVDKPSLRNEIALLERGHQDRLYVLDLERKCLFLEKDYADLRQRLVNLLRPEQIDAAKTCGITPEIYALEWIEIVKDDLQKFAPGHADYIGGLRNLQR